MLENEKQFKTAMLAYLSSREVATNDLRVYARTIGVESPTTKKNDVLMEEITAILLGELEPVPISRHGAPVKNKVVNPAVLQKINALCEEYHIFDKYKEKQPKSDNVLPKLFPKGTSLVFEDATEINQDESVAFCGQVSVLNGVTYILPLDAKNGKKILLADKLVEEHLLKEGDVVNCQAMQGRTTLVATQILSVNGFVAKSFTRSDFDEGIPCYPEEPLELGEVDKKSLKYFDWVLPIRKGQRACIVAPPKAGKSQALYDLAISIGKGNSKTSVFVLLIDQSPEAVGKFRRAFENDKVVYTTYEDDAERQVFAAEFLLKRAKRFVEHGLDVVLFVDSLTSLARAYNETDESSGGKVLAGGMESKTLQYIKRFFGAARKIENGGSLTIVGAVSADTGNPADELVCSELVGVSNFEVRLSGDLAAKHVYPAIEPLKSKTGDGAPITQADQILRSKYLPKFGVESFLNLLGESKTKEDFYKALQNAVEV